MKAAMARQQAGPQAYAGMDVPDPGQVGNGVVPGANASTGSSGGAASPFAAAPAAPAAAAAMRGIPCTPCIPCTQ